LVAVLILFFVCHYGSFDNYNLVLTVPQT
jgi:hypothetical protein